MKSSASLGDRLPSPVAFLIALLLLLSGSTESLSVQEASQNSMSSGAINHGRCERTANTALTGLLSEMSWGKVPIRTKSKRRWVLLHWSLLLIETVDRRVSG